MDTLFPTRRLSALQSVAQQVVLAQAAAKLVIGQAELAGRGALVVALCRQGLLKQVMLDPFQGVAQVEGASRVRQDGAHRAAGRLAARRSPTQTRPHLQRSVQAKRVYGPFDLDERSSVYNKKIHPTLYSLSTL